MMNGSLCLTYSDVCINIENPPIPVNQISGGNFYASANWLQLTANGIASDDTLTTDYVKNVIKSKNNDTIMKPLYNKKTLGMAFQADFMAGAEGLEPSTYGFGDRRSTN